MTSPSGTCASLAFDSLSSPASSLMAGHLHRRAGDLDADAIELFQNRAVDAVLDFTDAVLGDHEADRQLEPVVGERPEDARLERLVFEPVLALQPRARPGGRFLKAVLGAAHGRQQDGLRPGAIG